MKLVEYLDKLIDESSSLKEALSKLRQLDNLPHRGRKPGTIKVSAYVVKSFERRVRRDWQTNVIPINRYKRLRRKSVDRL